jgi:serine/threonine protein kinase
VADEFLARRERGENPAIEEFAARYPRAADMIRRTLAALDLAGGSLGGSAADPEPISSPLGDYRIVREVGRGGMGIVYEAEQLSLRRRVALKVLPFAAVLNPKHLQRFHSEALAAAVLDHPNAVKVYGVGHDRGMHYIAMQFVEGRPLSDLIRERRGDATRGSSAANEATRSLTADDTPPPAVFSAPVLSRTSMDLAYARRAAEWGVQAAEALEHAHSLGVVHRDIKPSNLLVDGRGELFVADFGLARFGKDPGVTGTGDLLGTPRYMSPEQATAQHNLVDHRSDVYSLGATLYELLALIPAVAGRDHADVLRRVADAAPTPLRKLVRRVPPELETVVLKCLEKDPSRRYQSAQELADDLRRFLENRPVRARRQGRLSRARRWSQRNRLATVFMVSIALGLATTSGLTAWALRERDRADRNFKEAREFWVIETTVDLRSRVLLKEDREWMVAHNGLLTDSERTLALEFVRKWKEPTDPRVYFERSWEVVRNTRYGDPAGGVLESYAREHPQQYREAILSDKQADVQFRFALHHAEAACRLDPNNLLYRTARGASLYRLDRHQEALDVLAGVDPASPQGLYAIAFKAMARYKLGDRDEARSLVAGLARRLKAFDWPDDFDARAFLLEAESVTGLRQRKPWE